jgi:hypothetical protein
MPEGKVIEFQEGEYPELDGIEVGASVKLSGQATIVDVGEGVKGLEISSMNFETEGMADKEMRAMRGGDKASASESYSKGAGEDF